VGEMREAESPPIPSPSPEDTDLVESPVPCFLAAQLVARRSLSFSSRNRMASLEFWYHVRRRWVFF
jgi:hypothetical protein